MAAAGFGSAVFDEAGQHGEAADAEERTEGDVHDGCRGLARRHIVRLFGVVADRDGVPHLELVDLVELEDFIVLLVCDDVVDPDGLVDIARVAGRVEFLFDLRDGRLDFRELLHLVQIDDAEADEDEAADDQDGRNDQVESFHG